MSNEDKRQWVHLGVGAFALLIPFVTKWQAVGLAITAVVFNLVILSKLFPELFRESERPDSSYMRGVQKKFLTGIVAYPLTILILMLMCPWTRREVGAGAWAILAFGDSFSNLIGRYFVSAKLPWNRKKSVAGLVGFIITAFIGCGLLLMWVNPQLRVNVVLISSGVTAIVCGILETVDIGIDDNYVVGLSAGITLYLLIIKL